MIFCFRLCRTATVVSSDRLTELLLIYKEDYYNIVTVIRHADTMEKIVLLRKNPIFKVIKFSGFVIH